MKRDFNVWFSKFKDSIADYTYYVDFEKVYAHVDDIKVELNILNSLIGSKNIKNEFKELIKRYPEILKCIPILLAVREYEIYTIDITGEFIYNFKNMNYGPDQYVIFMEKTGLFDLMSNHIINNLTDYVTGVETGLDTNGRKNRAGDNMENLVESYIQKSGFLKGKNYFKEMDSKQIEKNWGVDLSPITNYGKAEKRFDFVIKSPEKVYGIETNFYSGGGSKLNETARSYKNIALESKGISGFSFVWITDGRGWENARNNLEETFSAMDNLYNIDDLENGIFPKIIK